MGIEIREKLEIFQLLAINFEIKVILKECKKPVARNALSQMLLSLVSSNKILTDPKFF